jgi:hypothetical protein
MDALWIDSPTYVGPCRRGGRIGLRLLNRRRSEGAGQTPSLKTLVRQLRVADLCHADEEALRHFRLRVSAAARLAARLDDASSAEALARLSASLEAAEDVRAMAAEVAESLAAVAACLT